MKVVGFTIVRNAIKFDYPILESLASLLPMCDEVIVSVGKSEDETLNLIKSISSPKLKIIESTWDDSLRKGGVLLAIETNKALDAVPRDADWLFYLQADELLHEKDADAIRSSMLKWKDDKNVDGLLFNYNHFYGSYDYLGDSHKWYRKEIRIIRNDKHIRSYKDAQGFRKFSLLPVSNDDLLNGGEKLRVKQSGGTIYHYGWVKHPEFQQNKQKSFNKMWHGDEWMEKKVGHASEFDYNSIDSLAAFTGEHPAPMQIRVSTQNWKYVYDGSKKKFSFKERLLRFTQKTFGWRPGEYKNYKLV